MPIKTLLNKVERFKSFVYQEKTNPSPFSVPFF